MSDPDAADPGLDPRPTIRRLIAAALATRSAARPVGDDDTLVEIGMTSTDMVALLLGVESAFDIEIPPDEMTPDLFRSVTTIAGLVRRLQAHARPA